MKKVFYEDSYKMQHNTVIKEIIECEYGCGLVFEETIFFPGGGGQPSDVATLFYKEKQLPIHKAYEDGEKIVHIISKDISDVNFSIGDDVTINIDRSNRLDGMCQHSAQHLLSGIIYKNYKRNTLGLHIGKYVTQLDIEGEFTDEEIMTIEEEANYLISQNIQINTYIYDGCKEDVHTRRPLPKTDEDIRILEIKGIDVNACCGVHVKELKDIGIIKIKKFYRNKGATRIEFLAGKRAVDYLLKNDRVFSNIQKKFNSNPETIEKAIKNLEEKKDQFYRERDLVLNRYIDIFIDKELKDVNEKVVSMDLGSIDGWIAKEVVNRVVENKNIIFFAMYNEGGRYYFLAQAPKEMNSSYINLSEDYKNIASDTKIKGGGNSYFVQAQSLEKKEIDFLLKKIYYVYIEKMGIEKGEGYLYNWIAIKNV